MADAHQILAAFDVGGTTGPAGAFGFAARQLETHHVVSKWPALHRPVAGADAPRESKEQRRYRNDGPPEGLSHSRPPFSSEHVLHVVLIYVRWRVITNCQGLSGHFLSNFSGILADYALCRRRSAASIEAFAPTRV